VREAADGAGPASEMPAYSNARRLIARAEALREFELHN
jgi:hypothetical protein